MSLAWWLPELFRELRFWGASSACPWGGILLAIFVCCAWCFLAGLLAGACIFSTGCRRAILVIIRVFASEFHPGNLHPGNLQPLDLRNRLAQYRH